jgi:hypothetical protein
MEKAILESFNVDCAREKNEMAQNKIRKRDLFTVIKDKLIR